MISNFLGLEPQPVISQTQPAHLYLVVGSPCSMPFLPLGTSKIVKQSIHTPLTHSINSCNVTHSLISRNLREWMFLVQISLLIVTFLYLISRVLKLMQLTNEINLHPRIAPHVNMWSVFFLFFFSSLCHLLNNWCMDLSHCLEKQVGGWHVRMDYVLWYRRFPMWGFVLDPKP